jgi:hypothetical protein
MNIDQELLADLSEAARRVGVTELSPAEAEHIARSAQAKFVTAPEATWWWTALREPAISLRYGNEDGVTLLLRLLPSDTTLLLFVTDDESAPWPAFEGAPLDLARMLREERVFEFWVAPRDMGWIVFDTHENALVVGGSLVAVASTLDAISLLGG